MKNDLPANHTVILIMRNKNKNKINGAKITILEEGARENKTKSYDTVELL
jgi:hypothetical protein